MKVWYRREYEDGYTFIFAATKDPCIDRGKYEELAKDMHELARGYGACTSVITLHDDEDNAVAVFGVVCDDCDPNESESEGERLLCKLVRGWPRDG